MSNIQKYVKRYQEGGELTGFGQLLQQAKGKFEGVGQGAEMFSQMKGDKNFAGLLGDVIGGEGAGFNIAGDIAGGVNQGGGIDIKGAIGTVLGGGKLDPLSLASQGLDSLADDKDATTYTAKEIGADAVGVAMGAGRILTGDVIGGGKQLIGEAVDIGKSIFGRKKARKEQRAAESAAKSDFFAREGEAAEQRVAEQVMGGQMQRAEDASGSLQAMMDKYSEASAQQRGTLAEKGARLYYEAGGEPREGSRPVDLRKAKYQEGGEVPMYGGVPIYSANDPEGIKAMKLFQERETQARKDKANKLIAELEQKPHRKLLDKFIKASDATFLGGFGALKTGTPVCVAGGSLAMDIG